MAEGNPTQSLLSLRLGELDLVLGYEYPFVPLGAEPGTEQRELLVDPLVALLPAGLFVPGRDITLAALSGQPWAMAPPGTSYGLGVCRAGQAAGFEADVRFQTYDVSVMEVMVAAGLAVAVVPDLALVAHPLPAGGERRAPERCRPGPSGLHRHARRQAARTGGDGDHRRTRCRIDETGDID